MEPIVIVSATVVGYYLGVAVLDTLKDLRREKGRWFFSTMIPVKVRCRDHAYNESLAPPKERW
ncbi:hypothetical protein L4X63_01935 [Geomonas sp. Red32]|uniref:hypothetical protein n=1 Tax=Geomonas sp. Red32 TaxID=2912856 RepID=UPI00202CAF8D|nr:hypothetical protein [Geomonas sp. Red32]MCM0080338.1 hypothetical protein [Geomonas sp. Red32]